MNVHVCIESNSERLFMNLSVNSQDKMKLEISGRLVSEISEICA